MIALRPLAAAFTVLAMLGMPIAAAEAADLPGGYTCSDLRSKVAEYGRALVLAAARSRGFSDKEIAQNSRKMQSVILAAARSRGFSEKDITNIRGK